MKVTWNGGNKYGVKGPWDDQVVVDMQEKTCSCRKWELTGMVCKHALATIWEMAANNMQVGTPESWVHPAHWLVTWEKVYSYKINPVIGKKLWRKHPSPNIITPPKHHPQIGRPRKARKKSADELSSQSMVDGVKLSRKGKTVTCLKCKQTGHNKRTCTGRPPVSSSGGSRRTKKTASRATQDSAKDKGKQPMQRATQ